MSQDSSADPALPPRDASPPPPPPPTGPPERRRSWLTITLIAAVVVAVGCVGGGYLLLNSLREDVPQAGECLLDAPDPNDMTVVGCDSDQAAWSVIGADGTMTQAEFQALTPEDGVCQEHAGTEQVLWVTDAWFVDDGTAGTVVCLRRVGEAAQPPGSPPPGSPRPEPGSG